VRDPRIEPVQFCTLAGGKTRAALNVENVGSVRYDPTVDGDNNIPRGASTNARITLTQSW
jgi:hypothetical protein